jgi:hypothetical protein
LLFSSVVAAVAAKSNVALKCPRTTPGITARISRGVSRDRRDSALRCRRRATLADALNRVLRPVKQPQKAAVSRGCERRETKRWRLENRDRQLARDRIEASEWVVVEEHYEPSSSSSRP